MEYRSEKERLLSRRLKQILHRYNYKSPEYSEASMPTYNDYDINSYRNREYPILSTLRLFIFEDKLLNDTVVRDEIEMCIFPYLLQ